MNCVPFLEYWKASKLNLLLVTRSLRKACRLRMRSIFVQ
jgi:hypothetical protein